MCGIAGILRESEKVDLGELKKMTDAIIHRGPDGEGQWINNKMNIGLGHRRLSIIDLSDRGSQPMHYAESRYTITFNGEIYNYLEIRKDLLKKGFKFYSDSDTEVLLALYHDERENCLSKLDGMFAFAIWDEEEQSLFCARDRFGEKPFYYIHETGKAFYFASEMKALWAIGFSKDIKADKIGHYLRSNELLDADDLSSTFYNGISQLDGAHFMTLKDLSKIEQKNYYNLNSIQRDNRSSVTDASDQLFDLLQNSVRLRLRSDVPVGSSLSGGLDSSAIVKLIELLKPADYTQNTFSARFADFRKDEGKYIKEIVQSVKYINSFEVWPNSEDLSNEFDKCLYYQEEPFGSGSIFAQWKVMELAKKNNVTVLIDGQGADEFLGGYTHSYHKYLDQLYFNNRSTYKSELTKYNSLRGEQLTQRQNATVRQRLSYLKQRATGGNKLYPRDYLNNHLKKETIQTGLKVLLRYGDRNSMAHSREVRLPFTDHKIVDFVFTLPDSFKFNQGFTKWILRKATQKILPPIIAWRPDKIGYEVPQEVWLTKLVNDKMKSNIHEYLLDHRIDTTAISNWNYYMIYKNIC